MTGRRFLVLLIAASIAPAVFSAPTVTESENGQCDDGSLCLPDKLYFNGTRSSGNCSSCISVSTSCCDDLKCFPSDANVLTSDPGTPIKSMQELLVGDHVLATNTHGELVYSPVIAFLDRAVSEKASFVQVHSEDGHKLMLTPYHLIFTNSSEQAVFASSLQPGDYVYTLDSDRRSMALSKVTAVELSVRSKASGIYAPLTEEGTIVVDGILASCYALVKDQQLAHGAFAPLRFMNYIMPDLVGMQPSRMHWYSKFLQTSGTFLYKSGMLPESILRRTGSLAFW